MIKFAFAIIGIIVYAATADAAEPRKDRSADRFNVPGACVLIVETIGGKVKERQYCNYTADQIARMREGKGATGK